MRLAQPYYYLEVTGYFDDGSENMTLSENDHPWTEDELRGSLEEAKRFMGTTRIRYKIHITDGRI